MPEQVRIAVQPDAEIKGFATAFSFQASRVSPFFEVWLYEELPQGRIPLGRFLLTRSSLSQTWSFSRDFVASARTIDATEHFGRYEPVALPEGDWPPARPATFIVAAHAGHEAVMSLQYVSPRELVRRAQESEEHFGDSVVREGKASVVGGFALPTGLLLSIFDQIERQLILVEDPQ